MTRIVRVQDRIAKRLPIIIDMEKTTISYEFCLCYNAIVKKFNK